MLGSVAIDKMKDSDTPKRFLRKPRAPKVQLPPPPPPPPARFDSDIPYTINSQYGHQALHDDLDTPTDPVSPPPPTELQSRPYSRLYERTTRLTNQPTGSYQLDPVFREQTNIGTYVEGTSLVKPYRPRGPAALPCRIPKRNPPLSLSQLLDDDDLRYYQPPAFTLQDFIIKMSEGENIPIERVQAAVFSKYTYKKLQTLLQQRCMPANQSYNTVELQLSDEAACTSPRVPQKQLLLEMTCLIKEQMYPSQDVEIKSMIRSLPSYSPDHKSFGGRPHTEILLYEDSSGLRETSRRNDMYRDHEPPGQEGLFHGPIQHFQGSRRSHSPFLPADDSFISPTELAVLDSIMSGGQALSLKATFIASLPDIEPLKHTITYLNLSFNDFKYVPPEISEMSQLTVLKMRNNPIEELSPDVGELRNLHTLVLSFCLLSSLPDQLFQLTKLEHLDISYNRVQSIPSQIQNLQQLRELNVEGNQLAALPASALKLYQLKHVRIRNNFMHPLFWKEHAPLHPMRLTDMAAHVVKKFDLHEQHTNLPDHIITFIKRHEQCDLCKGPRYGLELCSIRPVQKIFGVKNVPFIFYCCSNHCLNLLNNNDDSLTDLLYEK